MKIKWVDALKKGFRFSVNPRFWLPVFVCDFVFFIIGLLFVLYKETEIITVMNAINTGPAGMASAGGVLSSLTFIFAAWVLIRLWIQGALIRLSQKENNYIDSFKFSFSRYHHLLAATLIIGLFSFVVGLVPYLGTLFSFVISIIFFFVYPGIIIKKLGFWPALQDSYNMLMKHVRKFRIDMKETLFRVWLIILIVSLVATAFGIYMAPEMLLDGVSFWIMVAVLSGLLVYSKVTDIWAVVAVVATVLFLIFFSVFMGMVSYTLGGAVGAEGALEIAALLLLFKENIIFLGGAGIVLSLGTSISTALSLKAMTEFYMQLKKVF